MTTRALRAAIPALALIALLLAAGDAAASSEIGFDDHLDRGWLWVHLAAFGFGFLTSLTPCVYPMIPIVVGIFGAREAPTRGRGFSIGLAYVIGMGLTFSTLGVIFAAVGQQANQLLANPWVVWPMVGMYAALAASMFGAFELRLPLALQNRLAMVGGKGYSGAAAMGLVGGLTAAPCTGPFLVGLIGVIAATGNMVAGFTVMFAYALGIGVLFLFLAAFAVSLPKSGPWMEWVKSAGGIALLVVGLYFLRPVIPALRELASPHPAFLWGMIGLALVGLAGGALHLSFRDRWPRKLRKGLAVTIAVVGLSGALSSVLMPARPLPWVYDEAEAFATAAETDRGVMVDFYAEWCAPCKELELIFARPGVYERIVEGYVPLKFDVTRPTDENFELQERYGAHALPSVIFLDAEGNELGRITSQRPSESGVLEALDGL
jgi:thioredoxin:protein disulfide reductase